MSTATASVRARAGALLALAAVSVLAACGDDGYATAPADLQPNPPSQAVTASGDIATRVAEFRALLGEPANGGTAGEQPTGRREISWDGAGANPFNNRNDFPGDFFNTNVAAGIVLATPGSGFRNDSLLFAEVDASYVAQFAVFSASKVFAPVGSRVIDLSFRVAGEDTPARVRGFGAVFSDVDVAGRTTLEYFDALGRSIGRVTAPVRSDATGLSFAGARFDDRLVARVRITLGEAALAAGRRDVSDGGAEDLVVVDNLLYDEPRQAKPAFAERPEEIPVELIP